MAGAAYALATRQLSPWPRQVSGLLVALLVALGLVGYADTALQSFGQTPYRVTFGGQSPRNYLAANVSGYTALELLAREPRAARLFSAGLPALLYTNVPVGTPNSPGPTLVFTGPPDEVRRRLAAGGYSHILLDRNNLGAAWDRATVFDERFLREYTVLVGGDRNAYLFRLLTPRELAKPHPWARGPELAIDGGFELASGAAPAGWSMSGQPAYDRSGRYAASGVAAVRAGPADALFVAVPVTAGKRYLLSHSSVSADGAPGAVRLQVNWQDATGKLVTVSIEVVPTNTQRYYEHSMLSTAPPGAVSAVIYVQPQQGVAWFDNVSFRATDGTP